MSVVYYNGQGLMTNAGVLARLGLHDGQSVNEGMMWKVMTENAGDFVAMVRSSDKSVNVDDLEAKVELNRMASRDYQIPKPWIVQNGSRQDQ